jgi:hypothetical protein
MVFFLIFLSLSFQLIQSIDKDETIFKEAIERFPLSVIFSKTAPSNLDQLNYDTDFTYYYFSMGIERRSHLNRSKLCDGMTNAKKDFHDFNKYFDDDVNVIMNYKDGKLLYLCEPWSPPGISSFVFTIKTTLESESKKYMLGCFDVVDDIVLGITSFKKIDYDGNAPLSPASSSGSKVPLKWFKDAFNALPYCFAIIYQNRVLYVNYQWLQLSLRNNVEVNQINQLFHSNEFPTNPIGLLNSSAWMTNISISKSLFDVGTYGILDNHKLYQVLVLRPTMSSTTRSRWQADYKDMEFSLNSNILLQEIGVSDIR